MISSRLQSPRPYTRSSFASEKPMANPLPTTRGVTVKSAGDTDDFTLSIPFAGSAASAAAAVRTSFPSRSNAAFGQSDFKIP